MQTEGYLVQIIDDDAAVRRSLALLVRSAGFDAETYPSASAYLAHGPQGRHGCILLDVRMPGMDGLKLLERLNERQVLLPVIMITGYRDIEIAVRAMKLGAVEFLEKPFAEEALFSAIAVAQERPLARAVDDHIADAAARLATLTRRELEVLSALAAGHQQKAIAYDLGISVRTVEVHRARMMRRLGTSSLARALRLFVLAGLDSTEQGMLPAHRPLGRS